MITWTLNLQIFQLRNLLIALIVGIPLKSAGRSGVILPPVYIMLTAERESTQVAGLAQAAADCSRWPCIARMDIPVSGILIA